MRLKDNRILVRSTVDARAFRDGAQRLVSAHPVLHSVLATTVDHAIARPKDYPGARWYWATRGGSRWIAAGMHTAPRPFHLVSADPTITKAFAYRLRELEVQLDAVSGMRGTALAFAESWVDLGGAAAISVRRREGLYDLPREPIWQHRAAGALRPATQDDMPLLDSWAHGYADDNHTTLAPGHTMAGFVARGGMRIWELDGEPVSMVYASRPHGGVSRISWAYTPPERRGQGFGSVIVAATAREQRRAGHRVLLYTDLDNQPATRLYERVGFRRIGDAAVINLLDSEPAISIGSNPLRKPKAERPGRRGATAETTVSKSERRLSLERMIRLARRERRG